MSVYSMTGFASHLLSMEAGQLRWEIRSVNHRFLEVSFKLPDNFKKLEFSLRKLLVSKIKRGKIDCYLQIDGEFFNPTKQIVNFELVNHVMTSLQQLMERYPILQPPGVTDILRWPNLVGPAEFDVEAVQIEIQNSFLVAIEKILSNRAEEGEVLKTILLDRLTKIESRILKIKDRAPELIRQQRSKILSRLQENKIELDSTRLEEELVYLLNKMDFTEEIDRLALHCRAAILRLAQTVAPQDSLGKHLDFIFQEMNRETHTLSAKANDAETAELVIELKVLIEQLREQVQNLE